MAGYEFRNGIQVQYLRYVNEVGRCESLKASLEILYTWLFSFGIQVLELKIIVSRL